MIHIYIYIYFKYITHHDVSTIMIKWKEKITRFRLINRLFNFLIFAILSLHHCLFIELYYVIQVRRTYI
jgi:hypothetical protein